MVGAVLCTFIAVDEGRIPCLQLTYWGGSRTVILGIFYQQESEGCVKQCVQTACQRHLEVRCRGSLQSKRSTLFL